MLKLETKAVLIYFLLQLPVIDYDSQIPCKHKFFIDNMLRL